MKKLIVFTLIFFCTVIFGSCNSGGNKQTTNQEQKTDNDKKDTTSQNNNYYSEYLVNQELIKRENITTIGKSPIITSTRFINEQKILFFVIKDINKNKVIEISNFYKIFYQNWAKENNNSATLQLWFFKNDLPNEEWYTAQTINLTSEENKTYRRCFFGNVFYVYKIDNEGWAGTLAKRNGNRLSKELKIK